MQAFGGTTLKSLVGKCQIFVKNWPQLKANFPDINGSRFAHNILYFGYIVLETLTH